MNRSESPPNMVDCEYNDSRPNEATHYAKRPDGPDKNVCMEHKNTIGSHETSYRSNDNPTFEPIWYSWEISNHHANASVAIRTPASNTASNAKRRCVQKTRGRSVDRSQLTATVSERLFSPPPLIPKMLPHHRE